MGLAQSATFRDGVVCLSKMISYNKKIEYIVRHKNNYLLHTLLPLCAYPHSFLSKEKFIQEARENADINEDFDLYVHVPFCRRKCRFCHTRNRIAVENEVNVYPNSLIKDFVDFGKAFSDLKLRNLWIGGGTPNIFTNDSLEGLFQSLFSSFKFRARGSYKTIELHPDLLSEQQIDLIKDSGFTDISIGTQSLNKTVLSDMRRDSSKIKNTKRLISYAMKKGFNEVNCDLVIFTRKDSLQFFMRSLSGLIKLKPDMITIFPLQLPGDYNYLAGTELSRLDFYKKTEKLFYAYASVIEKLAKKNGYRVFNGANYTPSLYIVRKGKQYNIAKYQPFPYQRRSILAFGHNARGNIYGKLIYDTEYLYEGPIKGYSKRYRVIKIKERDELLYHLFASFDTFGRINLSKMDKMFNINSREYFKNEFKYLFQNEILARDKDTVIVKEKSRIKVFANMLLFLDKDEIDRLYAYEYNQQKFL